MKWPRETLQILKFFEIPKFESWKPQSSIRFYKSYAAKLEQKRGGYQNGDRSCNPNPFLVKLFFTKS